MPAHANQERLEIEMMAIKQERQSKQQVRLRCLKEMVNLLEAHLVATPIDEEFVSFDPKEDSQSALARMNSPRTIDYAPILKNHTLVGYVYRNDLVGVIGKTCDKLSKPVPAKNQIPPNSSLEDVLRSLCQEQFLFVVEDGQLKGIITRADVIKRAFRTLFYIVLSELESQLVNLISGRFPREKLLRFLRASSVKNVLYREWKAKDENLEMSIEHYLSFPDIVDVILKSKDTTVWRELGHTHKKQVARLRRLVPLRNRVMHSTRQLIERKNSIPQIGQQYQQIWQLLGNLRENPDTSPRTVRQTIKPHAFS